MTHTTTVAVLVGSLRADSVNRRLALALRDRAPEGVVLDVVDDLGALPFYNEDVDSDALAVPAAALALRERVAAADVVLAVTPEYNGTMPAALNNAIDWLSRPYGAGALVASASASSAPPRPRTAASGPTPTRSARPASPGPSRSRTSPSRSRASTWTPSRTRASAPVSTPRSQPSWRERTRLPDPPR